MEELMAYGVSLIAEAGKASHRHDARAIRYWP